ncbi:MAG: sigma-70 family RNA polymerase sigma factor [Gemmatimonadota bacterium]
MTGGRDESSLALEKVLRRFEGQVRSIGRRFGFPPADLDELFQELRIRLWKALEDPERIGAASSSYVYRAATSAAVDLIRRQRRSRRDVPLEVEMARAGPGNPATQHELRQMADEVFRAVGRLDERRRPVVRMYLAGYNHKEIAGLLGWAEGATRNLLYRGLQDLREDLSSHSISLR